MIGSLQPATLVVLFLTGTFGEEVTYRLPGWSFSRNDTWFSLCPCRRSARGKVGPC